MKTLNIGHKMKKLMIEDFKENVAYVIRGGVVGPDGGNIIYGTKYYLGDGTHDTLYTEKSDGGRCIPTKAVINNLMTHEDYLAYIQYDESSLIIDGAKHSLAKGSPNISFPEKSISGEMKAPTKKGEIVSDGKSSSYYNLKFPKHLVNRILSQVANGEELNIETGDVIEMLVGNDFDAGNVIKALRRVFEGKQGNGKAGVSSDYDLNKCHYFLDEVKKKL